MKREQEESARDVEVRVRLSSEEKSAFTTAAKKESLKLSTWLRSVATRWLQRDKEGR